MSKTSRLHKPNPNAVVRVQLTPHEFKDLQGTCAIAAVALMTIKQQATQQIDEAQKPQRALFKKLAEKYKMLHPDRNYTLDQATCSLIEVK